MASENGVRFDPSRHRKNARGKWFDSIGKRLVRIDPATLPAEAAADPGARVEAELQGVALPDVSAVAAQVPAPSGAQSAEGAALQSAPAPDPVILELEGGPVHAGGPAPDGVPGLPGVGIAGAPAGAHIHGCWRAQSDGQLCACGAKVYEPMPDDELKMLVGMHELATNRMVRYPRPYNAEEREHLTQAFRVFSARYGNPAARFTPILMVAGTSYAIADARSKDPAAAPPAVGGGAG